MNECDQENEHRMNNYTVCIYNHSNSSGMVPSILLRIRLIIEIGQYASCQASRREGRPSSLFYFYYHNR